MKIRTPLTLESLKKYYRKSKEGKATSPSGRHLGILKTLLEAEHVMEVLFSIVQLAFKHQIILKRWQKTHILLLPKDGDEHRIHRFRHITLVEVTCNG